MSAEQAVLQFQQPPADHGMRSRCLMCDGTGWRLAMIDTNGDRRVARCECRRPRQPQVRELRDYKAAAAGDRS